MNAGGFDRPGGGHRREQFASTLREAVQEVLARGINDPRVRGLITVTDVTVSDDRREATVAVSVLPEEHQELTLHGLRAATTHIRKEAMRRVRSRVFPKLTFRLDTTLKRQAKIFEAIGMAARERDESQEEGNDAPAESGPAPIPGPTEDRAEAPTDAGGDPARDAARDQLSPREPED